MLGKKDLDGYQKKIEDGDKLLKRELDKVVTSFKDRVRFEAEDISNSKIKSIAFEDFFKMREYNILLSCVDQLECDIVELYTPLLKMCGYELNFDEYGYKTVVKFK